MSTDCLQHPDASLDAWVSEDEYFLRLISPGGGKIPLPVHLNGLFSQQPLKTTHTLASKKLERPRSVPATLTGLQSSQQKVDAVYIHEGLSRPKTALASVRPSCERVVQLEHESTRKHSMEAHLPPKKTKSPPWQKTLDSQPVPCVVTPGYTLSRSKSKIAVQLKTNEFFEPKANNKGPVVMSPERDELLSQLQQQIDDLTLFLEEERLNHRETKRKSADYLRDRINEINNHHGNEVRIMLQQHEEELESLRGNHAAEVKELKETAHAAITKKTKEVEFLQGAFESYKSQLHRETDERWKKKETEWRETYEASTEEKLRALRSKLIAEKNNEKAELTREHQHELAKLKRENKRDHDQPEKRASNTRKPVEPDPYDNLAKRYANAAADLQRLKETEQEIKEMKTKIAELEADYEANCKELIEATRDLTDARLKLAGYEEHFQDRVQEVDDKYKDRIHDLMTQNTELRRIYVKKCGELYEEKTEGDKARVDQLETAKGTMKLIIATRNKALVNLAATDPDLARRMRPQKERPASAPGTRQEAVRALTSASETEDAVKRRRERAPLKDVRPRILEQIRQEAEAEVAEADGNHAVHDGTPVVVTSAEE